jgi:hypothetical protein
MWVECSDLVKLLEGAPAMVSVMGSLGQLAFFSALSCLRVCSMSGSQEIKGTDKDRRPNIN